MPRSSVAASPTWRSTSSTIARADFQKLVDTGKGAEFAKTDPQLEQAYYELGVIALKQDRTQDAVDVLQKALAIDGGDADALYTFGKALVKGGDPAKGVAALRRAVQFVPSGWCEPYAALVDGYTALGQADGQGYATGMVAFCEGRYAEADAALRPLTGGPMATDALLGLALVAAMRGDASGATAFYKQVLDHDPKNASALIGLSQLGGPGAHASQPASSPAPATSN